MVRGRRLLIMVEAKVMVRRVVGGGIFLLGGLV